MSNLDKISNTIINSMSEKITDYIKDLYRSVIKDLSQEISTAEINSNFKKLLINEIDLKQMVFLNISALNCIQKLKEINEPLAVEYTNFLVDSTITKVSKSLNREIFHKKVSLKEKIKIINEKNNVKNKSINKEIKNRTI